MAKSFLGQAGRARGLRNNNPFNLVQTNIAWQGKIPLSQNTDGKFEQFTELRWGIRAGMRDIINDIKKGQNTIQKLISKFAPSFENNTNAYIQQVAAALGISTTTPLDLTEETVIALASVIVGVENGADAKLITEADYKEAIAILGIPLKKKVTTR